MPKVKVIGRGAFTKVWGDGHEAYIASTCDIKLAFSEFGSNNPMMPKLERYGSVPWEDKINIYKAPRYEKLTRPTKQLSPRYCKYYKQLLKEFRSPYGGYNSVWGYHSIVEKLNRANFTPALRNTLLDILDHVGNYVDADTICMEVSPRNLMAYKGKLIINDVLFDTRKVEEEGYYPYYLKQLTYRELCSDMNKA